MKNTNPQSINLAEATTGGFAPFPLALLAVLSAEEQETLQKLYVLAYENARQQAAWASFDFDLGELKRVHERARGL